MSPPALVGRIVRPCKLILESKEIAVRTVFGNKGSILIIAAYLIDFLAVKPFIK